MSWKKRIVFALVICAVVLAAVTLWSSLVGPPAQKNMPPTTPTTQKTTAPPTTPTTVPPTTPTTVPPTTPTTVPEETTSALEGSGKKLIAFTFDDGPHPLQTPKLLDILAQEQIKATFFVCGNMIENSPQVLQREAAEGHAIGCHSYNHKNLTKLSAKDRTHEIDDAFRLIDEIIGRPPTSFRPPYGAQNQAVCAAIPMPVLIWSVDTLDWKSRNADAVYRHLMKDTFDGSIVLMHDLYPSTIEAVRRAIPVLKAEGYTFVTVDALLAARGPAAPGEAVFERYPPAS